MPRRVYWDSCSFLGLLNAEPAKVTACRAVWDEARQGKTLIYTSFFAFAEVIKMKCEPGSKPLDEANDKAIAALLGESWIRPVVVDERIGVLARRLMRHHEECKKPSDAIHLATALVLNVDEMQTFDHPDLLRLDGKVLRADSKPLKICVPAALPSPPPPPSTADLFEGAAAAAPLDTSARKPDAAEVPKAQIPPPAPMTPTVEFEVAKDNAAASTHLPDVANQPSVVAAPVKVAPAPSAPT